MQIALETPDTAAYMFCNILQHDRVAVCPSPHVLCLSLDISDCLLAASDPCWMWTCFSIVTAVDSGPCEKLFFSPALVLLALTVVVGHSKAKGGNSCRLSTAVTTPSLVTHSTDLSAASESAFRLPCNSLYLLEALSLQRSGPPWYSVVSLVCLAWIW